MSGEYTDAQLDSLPSTSAAARTFFANEHNQTAQDSIINGLQAIREYTKANPPSLVAPRSRLASRARQNIDVATFELLAAQAAEYHHQHRNPELSQAALSARTVMEVFDYYRPSDHAFLEKIRHLLTPTVSPDKISKVVLVGSLIAAGTGVAKLIKDRPVISTPAAHQSSPRIIPPLPTRPEQFKSAADQVIVVKILTPNQRAQLLFESQHELTRQPSALSYTGWEVLAPSSRSFNPIGSEVELKSNDNISFSGNTSDTSVGVTHYQRQDGQLVPELTVNTEDTRTDKTGGINVFVISPKSSVVEFYQPKSRQRRFVSISIDPQDPTMFTVTEMKAK